jgi:hypothetical protein
MRGTTTAPVNGATTAPPSGLPFLSADLDARACKLFDFDVGESTLVCHGFVVKHNANIRTVLVPTIRAIRLMETIIGKVDAEPDPDVLIFRANGDVGFSCDAFTVHGSTPPGKRARILRDLEIMKNRIRAMRRPG